MNSKNVFKVMVSSEILKSGSIIKECNTRKKSNRYIKGKNYKKKTIRESGENTINKSHPQIEAVFFDK